MSYRNQVPADFYRDGHDENGNLRESPKALAYCGMNWSRLPTDFIIGTFKGVTILDLDDNLLTELPSYLVDALPGLQSLSVARNRLVKLPHNLGDWKQLKEINVPANRIEYLPLSVSNLKSLKYLNMDMNPINAAFETLFVGGRRWDVSGCQGIARQVYYVACQLPHAISETRRNEAHVAKFGPKTPPMVINVEPPKPYVKRAIPELIGKMKKTKEGQPKLNTMVGIPLAFKPLGYVSSRMNRSSFKSAPEQAPIVESNPAAHEPELAATPQRTDPTDSAWLPEEAVVSDKDIEDVLKIASDVFDTRSWEGDSNMNESQMTVQVPSKTLIGDFINESVTGIPIPESEAVPKPPSFWFQTLMALIMSIIELLKIGTYGCCIFGGLVGLATLFVDEGILIEFLARPWVNFCLPGWFQEIFVHHHKLALAHLVTYCVHIPLYRTPPKNYISLALTWVRAFFGALF